MDILDQVTTIFREVLDNAKINLTPDTSADDLEEWDSLSHIQLVTALEKHFKIKFQAKEIRNWKNVGQLCNSISEKVTHA